MCLDLQLFLFLLQVMCWGVRNMQKFQLASVTSPSIEFEVGGHVVQSKVIRSTKKNPNFDDPLLFFDIVSWRWWFITGILTFCNDIFVLYQLPVVVLSVMGLFYWWCLQGKYYVIMVIDDRSYYYLYLTWRYTCI